MSFLDQKYPSWENLVQKIKLSVEDGAFQQTFFGLQDVLKIQRNNFSSSKMYNISSYSTP